MNDHGHINGIPEKDLDRVSQAVDNVAYNNCEPPVTVVMESSETGSGPRVLIVNVPKGEQRPYRTNRGVYFVRTSSGRRHTSREELLRLFQMTESLYYDEVPVLRSRMDDLSEQAIKNLLMSIQGQGVDVAGIAEERLLVNWHLAQKTPEGLCPSISGILFLARTPQFFLPYAYITALRIPGTDISIPPSDQKRIEGRLEDMLEDAFRFLNLHLMRPHIIEGLAPEVRPELPVAALRETMVNALAHRDYTIAAPIRLIIFNDRIEFRTPGGLPNTITLDALRLGVHVLRNPTIYNVFLKVGLVTDAGSGIPRVIRLLREHTGNEPEFCLEGNEFVVKIPRKKEQVH